MQWAKYQTTKFKPKLKDILYSSKGTCGVSALAYLTGLTQRTIDKSTPKKGWWSDKNMIQFLRKRGFDVIEVTPERNYQNRESFSFTNFYKNSINHLNVILASQHTSRSEGTWSVIHDNRYYHGLEVEVFTGYELMANPIWTSYVVFHPSWKTKEKELQTSLASNNIALVNHDSIKVGVQLYNPYTGRWERQFQKEFGDKVG